MPKWSWMLLCTTVLAVSMVGARDYPTAASMRELAGRFTGPNRESATGRPAPRRMQSIAFEPEPESVNPVDVRSYLRRPMWRLQNTLAFARGVLARALRLARPGEALQAQRIVRRCQRQIRSLEVGSSIAPRLFWVA